MVDRRRRGDGVGDVLGRGTLLLWGLLLFVGSRTNLSGFPDRFERDLSVPVALFAALAAVTVLHSLAVRASAVTFAAGVAALLVGAVLAVQVAHNLQLAAGPSERRVDGPPPPQVAAAGQWLRENNRGGNILSTPYVSLASARGMMAMGGYTGVQSYTEKRLRRARDLPPSGAGPLWDALWTLRHPGDERARDFIEKNDVRYVVLYKRFPDIEWRAFEERGDLYRKVFENGPVVIFAPRES